MMAPLRFPRRLRGASIQAEERPKRAIPYCASHERNGSDNQRNRHSQWRQASKRPDSDHENSHDDSNRPFDSPYIACHNRTSGGWCMQDHGCERHATEMDEEKLKALD
jgi:hypothetical protein